MQLKFTKFSPLSFLLDNLSRKEFYRGNVLNTLNMISKGFDVSSVHMQGLNPANYKQFLPDRCVPRITLNTNKGYWPVFHDKYVFYQFIKGKLPTNQLLGVVFDGKLSGVDGQFGVQELKLALDRGESFVLKPLQGGNSEGILFLKANKGIITLQAKPMTMGQLEEILKKLDKYGVFRFHEQHARLAKIFPDAVSTIRLITIYDSEKKQTFIFTALLRIGWSGTAPLHGFAKGGVISQIDLETGTLAAGLRLNQEGKAERCLEHPDTGTLLEGIKIPYWTDIKKTILDFADQHPMFTFLGWDILVGNDGFLIIEANHNPGIQQLQALKPFFSDPRAAAFFKESNIFAGW